MRPPVPKVFKKMNAWLNSTAICALAVASTVSVANAAEERQFAGVVLPIAQTSLPVGQTALVGQTFRMQMRTAINLPLTFNGRFLGDIASQFEPGMTDVKIDGRRLLELLKPEITDFAYTNLETLVAGRQQVPINSVRGAWIEIEYDAGNVQLVAKIGQDEQRTRNINVAGLSDRPDLNLIEPSDFAAALSVNASQSFDHIDALFGDFVASAQVFASWRGAEGVVLLGDFRFDQNYDDPWIRGNVTLFHDDYENALRYSAGDTTLENGLALSASPIVGGVSVERRYSEIQPLRNVRPSGGNTVRIETPSTVEVYVNGVLSRTLQLAPGTYSLSDFPLSSGQNDLQLAIIDGSGRRQEFRFSAYDDIALLDPGIFNFGLAFGFPQESASDRIRYSSDIVTDAYVELGVLNWLTVGAAAQATAGFYGAGLSLAIGSDLGLLSGQVFGTDIDGLGRGYSARVQYRFDSKITDEMRWSFDAAYDRRSVDFRSLDQFTTSALAFFNQVSDEANARLTLSLPWNASIGLNGRYTDYFTTEPARKDYGVSYSQQIDQFGLSVSYERNTRTVGMPDDERVSASLVYRFDDPDQYMRANYDSSDFNGSGETTLEYAKYSRDRVGDWGVRAGLSHSDSEVKGYGGANYVDNRFIASVDHDIVSSSFGSDITREVTRYAVGSAIGYAGGKVAVGRPLTGGFAVVDKHETLKDATISVSQTRSGEDSLADADWFGPGLVPIRQAYTPSTFPVSGENLPQGYDMGQGQFTVFAPARAGYAYTVGSAAYITVVGNLVGTDGKPMGLVSGTLEPISGKDAKTVVFFTNRNGRLAATQVAPGRYKVILAGEASAIAEVTVPENSNGYVDLGSVRK